jgi:hypothetical protein
LTVTFDFAALTYLNYWLDADRHIHAALQSDSTTDKLAALKKAAAQFRIARNLHKQYDVGRGLPRYGPVLEIIDSLTARDFTVDLAQSVIDVRDRLSSAYGDRDVLSATTKLLWVKIQTPIIIYDSQARTAIGTPDGDLSAYYESWGSQYSDHESDITDACSRLTGVLSYIIDHSVATKSYVDSVAQTQWFKQRVFDIYLWHVGNK